MLTDFDLSGHVVVDLGHRQQALLRAPEQPEPVPARHEDPAHRGRGDQAEIGPLFEMRLTHEELVQAKSDFLRTAEELNVVQQEIDRLTIPRGHDRRQGGAGAKVRAAEATGRATGPAPGVAAARVLRGAGEGHPGHEDAVADADRVGLRKRRRKATRKAERQPIQELKVNVQKGQHVTAGDMLALLTDHVQLLIEGEAFEHDGTLALEAAAESKRKVSAVIEAKRRLRNDRTT